MSKPLAAQMPPGQSCQVLLSQDLFVSHGVNLGDGLLGPDEVCPGDLYQLESDHRPLRLVVTQGAGGQIIGEGSEVGQIGAPLRFESRYSLMSSDGDRVEVLVISLQDGTRFALPLSPMAARVDYTLLMVEDAPETTGLADLLCISFAQGTMITLANGRQCAIEALTPGQMLLTRDHGPQPLRWIGKATLRAVGVFSPVVITAGTLGNAGDLIVSQHHRMFLYQANRRAGFATSELLVQAKHLVDGERVFLREGGFVNYFSIVFDHHEIIYAEGIPAESLMVNEATVHRLPPDLSDEMKERFPGLNQNQHFGTEAGRQFLDAVGPKALYKSDRPKR